MSTPLSASVEIDIPFYDVDSMRIAWHGHYLKYFERARCALLEKLDYNYLAMEASGYIWPVIDCRIKYIRPLHFQQVITVTATLKEWENRLKLEYLIQDADGNTLTRGYSIQVAVDMQTEEMCYVSPPVFLEKVRCATG